MKKFLIILIITPIVLMACSPKAEEIEAETDTSSDPVMEDNLDEASKTLDDLEELGIE